MNNSQKNNQELIIKQLQKIIDTKDSNERTIQINNDFVDNLAAQLYYKYKNVSIPKLENVIKQMKELSLKNRDEQIDFFLSNKFQIFLNSVDNLRDEILPLAQNEIIKEVKSYIPRAVEKIKNIDLPLMDKKSRFGTYGAQTKARRRAIETVKTSELFNENLEDVINNINEMIKVLNNIDPTYADTIGNITGNFRILDYNYNGVRGPAIIKQEKGTVALKYNEFGPYIDRLHKYHDLVDEYTKKMDAGDPNAHKVFAPVVNWKIIGGTGQRENMIKFLNEILDKVNTDVDRLINQKFQTGGGVSELVDKIISILMQNIVLLKAIELLNFARTIKNNNKNKSFEQQPDYIQPLISLLSYKIGYLNNYDISLVNYCKQLGLDSSVILAIYFAERRQDIEEIIKLYLPNDFSPIMRIIQLKKLSAEQKFRINYDIKSDMDILILNEKKLMWDNIIL